MALKELITGETMDLSVFKSFFREQPEINEWTEHADQPQMEDIRYAKWTDRKKGIQVRISFQRIDSVEFFGGRYQHIGFPLERITIQSVKKL